MYTKRNDVLNVTKRKESSRRSFAPPRHRGQRERRSAICLAAVPLLREQFIERYPIIFGSLERRTRNEPINGSLCPSYNSCLQ